jgi:DNA-binding response OmpR family regulator
MKIAIVEDDKELNKLITKILNKEGYNAHSFFDGEEILNSKLDFDLYLIDINLPKINGLDLIDLINGNILIISANTNGKIIDKVYKKGVIDYIKKPFVKEELLHKINRIHPKELNFYGYILRPKERLLIKENQTSILTKKELDFLLLFSNTEFVSLEEIYNKISKKNNAFYVFLSKLKKKTGLEFENLKNLGYKIKEK